MPSPKNSLQGLLGRVAPFANPSLRYGMLAWLVLAIGVAGWGRFGREAQTQRILIQNESLFQLERDIEQASLSVSEFQLQKLETAALKSKAQVHPSRAAAHQSMAELAEFLGDRGWSPRVEGTRERNSSSPEIGSLSADISFAPAPRQPQPQRAGSADSGFGDLVAFLDHICAQSPALSLQRLEADAQDGRLEKLNVELLAAFQKGGHR